MIPDTLFLDFTNELQPLRGLSVSYYPHYNEDRLTDSVQELLKTLAHNDAVEYDINNYAVCIVEKHFGMLFLSDDKLSELRSIFRSVAFSIYNKIANMSGYKSGVFPFEYNDMSFCSELKLKQSPMLRYTLDLKTGSKLKDL